MSTTTGLRRPIKRCQLVWHKWRAGELPGDRINETRLRERARDASREQQLDEVGTGSAKIMLGDEHMVIGRDVRVSLAEVQRVDVEGPEVAVRVQMERRVERIALPDVPFGRAQSFVERTHAAIDDLPRLRAIYEARSQAIMDDLKALQAERAADRKRHAQRAETLERELGQRAAGDASSSTGQEP